MSKPTCRPRTRQRHRRRAATADEWFEAHADADAEEDPDPRINDEHEFADTHDERARDLAAAVDVTPPDDEQAEAAPDDIRVETADRVPDDDQRDAVRVPAGDETADTVDRARRAIRELRDRQAVEEHPVGDEARDDELAAWHDDPATREPDLAEHTDTADDGPVLEPSSPIDE